MGANVLIKRILYVILAILIIVALNATGLYSKAFKPNVFLEGKQESLLYIPTGSTYEDVSKILFESNMIRNQKSFEWTARRKNYPNHVKPGCYTIQHRMSNNGLLNILRSGHQTPVRVTFNNIRTLSQLADCIAKQLEIKPDKLLELLDSKEIQEKYKLNRQTVICMFVPNTYEFYWNTSEEKFLDRMFREYNKFWDRNRAHLAEEMKLSREQIITLASIVNEETDRNDEKDRIAGVYMNRLNKKIPLQADPTVIYAIGDFTIKRVLRAQYQIDSPYNTYKYIGLPPGPICIPEISSIDAVLNYEDHKYLYFCAKADFSGYHNFAKTLDEHNRNAQLYRRELNKRRIYR